MRDTPRISWASSAAYGRASTEASVVRTPWRDLRRRSVTVRRMQRLAIALLVASCGGSDDDMHMGHADASIDSPRSIDAAIDSPAAALVLTSPTVTEGAAIPASITCDGANTSPQLLWSGNAMGAMSYAVVLTDKANGVVHWVIFDIPASATGLPANVEK